MVSSRGERRFWGAGSRKLRGASGILPDLTHAHEAWQGISRLANTTIRTNPKTIAAAMVQRREADSMAIGRYGLYHTLKYVSRILSKDGLQPLPAPSLLILEFGPLLIADTEINVSPIAE